jgi:hypothetical protein
MKKASFFVPMMTIFVAITLFFAVIMLQFKANSVLEHSIGADQFGLFFTYQRAENAMDYVELSAKYEMTQNLFALANNSEYYGESGCGRFASFNLWGDKNTYQCLPADWKTEFWHFFGQAPSSADDVKSYIKTDYLDKYTDKSVDDSVIKGSDFFKADFKDIMELKGKDKKTELVLKQAASPLAVTGKNFKYTIPFTFRQSTEPNFIAAIDYLKTKAPDMAGQFKNNGDSRDIVFTDAMPDGTTMLWHNGGCVDDTTKGIDLQAEEFFRFVEAFEDCIQRDIPTNAPLDEFKQQKAKCGQYDLSKIGATYAYVIRPTIHSDAQYPSTYLELRKDDKALWGVYVKTNGFILAYRYTCGDAADGSEFGKADCAKPTAMKCNIDLKSDEKHCQFCNVPVSQPYYSCVEGRDYCVSGDGFGASCDDMGPAVCAIQDCGGLMCCPEPGCC